MRKELYRAICKQLEDANIGIKHFSLWNQDTEVLTAQPGYATPAIFIEFEPIVWEQRQNNVRVADVRIWLHVVLATLANPAHKSKSQDKALELLDIIESVSSATVGLSGENFNAFMLKESVTDHDYKQIQHHKECFVTNVTDRSKSRNLITGINLAETKKEPQKK